MVKSKAEIKANPARFHVARPTNIGFIAFVADQRTPKIGFYVCSPRRRDAWTSVSCLSGRTGREHPFMFV